MEKKEQPIIELKEVYKSFRLYEKKNHRVREVLHPFRKKYHKAFQALNHIDLNIYPGEIVGILGHNGSGKSTLLKVIAGVIQPNRGTVQVRGRIVPLLELGAGFNPEFTGRENIYFYNSIQGFSQKQTDAILDDILEFAEIGEFIDQPLRTYSSGMRARLGFAVSVYIDPEILILDEVFAVGDALFYRKCHKKMLEFFNQGKTILYVSHSIESIRSMCNRAVLLHKGELLLDGPTELVTREYARLQMIPPGEVNNWVQELKELNKSQSIRSEIQTAAPTPPVPAKKSQKSPEQDLPKTPAPPQILQPTFDPVLASTNSTQTINRIIEVSGISIYTLENQPVNVLVSGESYIFEFITTFEKNHSDIEFSITISNDEINPIYRIFSKALNNQITAVNKGNKIQVRWTFDCVLLQGLFYIGIGIANHGSKPNGTVHLIIIPNALVFRVVDAKIGDGVVDMKFKPTFCVVDAVDN